MVAERRLGKMRKIIFLVLVLSFIYGCAHTPIEVATVNTEEMLKAKEIWKKVEERNRAIEDSSEWISSSYDNIRLKQLINIPLEKYDDYKKFLYEGRRVYIINHPAFYTFFQHPKISRKNKPLSKNIMDLLLEENDNSGKNSSGEGVPVYDKKFVRTIKEFERIGKNFLEYKSTEQKLIILVLPGIYKKYPSYRYKDGLDEFARFLNEVTNNSESVLYIESKKANRGQLAYEDLNTLIEFLDKIGATSILLGGEYVGRCQEDFYRQLVESVGTNMTVEIVPELSPVSPDDMNSKMDDLIDSNDKFNVQAAMNNIIKNKYEKLEAIPKIRRLESRLLYDKPE